MTLLTQKLKRELSSSIKEFGYKSERDFVEDAIRHRLLQLKKADFLMRIKKVRHVLKANELSESDVLEDFEEFTHGK